MYIYLPVSCLFFTGLNAELFYVRDGAVNKYAMIFVVPVNASIYDLEFSWQSLTSHPVRTINKFKKYTK